MDGVDPEIYWAGWPVLCAIEWKTVEQDQGGRGGSGMEGRWDTVEHAGSFRFTNRKSLHP